MGSLFSLTFATCILGEDGYRENIAVRRSTWHYQPARRYCELKVEADYS